MAVSWGILGRLVFLIKEPHVVGASSFLSISLLPTLKVDVMPGVGAAILQH